jgi:hypothetical protein
MTLTKNYSGVTIRKFRRQKMLLAFVVLLLSINQTAAQSFHQQSRQLFGYNIILNGLIGGIGGLINKSKEENILKVFGRNFVKGSLGGIITYTAKYEVYQLRNPERFWVAPLDRAFYYLGNSFVYNASLNQNLFSAYRCQFYLFNFDFYFKKKIRIVPRISLLSVASVSAFFIFSDHLNFKNSLRYGVFYFNQNKEHLNTRVGLGLNNAIEITPYPLNVDGYKGDEWRYELIAHEMIHTFQFPDYISISNFMRKDFQGIKSKDRYEKWSKYFFLDGPFFPLLYVIYPAPNDRNFFEYEANHFSTRQFIDMKK